VKGKWSPLEGGGFVREGAEAAVAAAWDKWVRECELLAGCLPCPDAVFPGPSAAISDLDQMVRIAVGFAVSARRARVELGRNWRGK
jgi:hypothetical protein